MKRAYTIYYDDSGWSPKYNAMIYKYETGKYFDEESEPVRASILYDLSDHFMRQYNDGDPMSIDQLADQVEQENDSIIARALAENFEEEFKNARMPSEAEREA